MRAARRKDLAEVRRQLGENPKSVNAVDEVTGDTALTWAARLGNVEMASVLLEAADIAVNHADALGRTALMRSCGNGDEALYSDAVGER